MTDHGHFRIIAAAPDLLLVERIPMVITHNPSREPERTREYERTYRERVKEESR